MKMREDIRWNVKKKEVQDFDWTYNIVIYQGRKWSWKRIDRVSTITADNQGLKKKDIRDILSRWIGKSREDKVMNGQDIVISPSSLSGVSSELRMASGFSTLHEHNPDANAQMDGQHIYSWLLNINLRGY